SKRKIVGRICSSCPVPRFVPLPRTALPLAKGSVFVFVGACIMISSPVELIVPFPLRDCCDISGLHWSRSFIQVRWVRCPAAGLNRLSVAGPPPLQVLIAQAQPAGGKYIAVVD